VYYHGRASDSQSMADVARRHGQTVGTDGARFGPGDTMTRITEPGTPKLTAQGIEGFGTQETGTIGRRSANGGLVRGNNIRGVAPGSVNANAKIAAGGQFLDGRSPSAMSGETLAGRNYTKPC
jgi:hypothetical protein